MVGQGAEHVIELASGEPYRLYANKLNSVEQMLVLAVPLGKIRGGRSRTTVHQPLKLANGVEQVMVRGLSLLQAGLVSVRSRLFGLSPALRESHTALKTRTAVAGYAGHSSRENNC